MIKPSVSEHLEKHGHKAIVLSPHLLAYWHARLNRELFRGKLHKCRLTYGRTRVIKDPVYGYYFEGRIHIDGRVRTKRALLDTLAHEMIHQLQDQHGQPTNHGKDFRAWARRLTPKGIIV